MAAASTKKVEKPLRGLRSDLMTLQKMSTHNFGDRIHTDVDEKERDMKLHPMQRVAKRILLLPSFDYFVGLIIVINLGVMVIETDRSVDEELAPLVWTSIFGWAVLVIFSFEVSMKILVYGCLFWRDIWSVCDFLIIVSDAFFSVVGLIAGNAFPISVLRIFRLVKLARVSKILRAFPELRLLMAGLASAVTTIFWGSFLLMLFLLVWSIVAVLFIHNLNKHIDYLDCERCSRAYGSVASSMLTFWQTIVIGDGWSDVSVPLIEKHPVTLLFFVPLFLSVGMAVMNLILGVIVSVAEEAKSGLHEEDKTEKALEKLQKETELLKVCHRMDADRSGGLSHDELLACFDQPSEFLDILKALEIDKDDFDIVWNLLETDLHTGEVSFKDVIGHLCTLRISDSHFMLAYIKHYINNLKFSVHKMLCNMEQNLSDTRHEVEEEIQKIEESDKRFEEEIQKIEESKAKSVEPASISPSQIQMQEKDQVSNAMGNETSNLASKTQCSAPDCTLAKENREFPKQCACDAHPKPTVSKLTSFRQIEEVLSAALTFVRESMKEEFAATEPELKSEHLSVLPRTSEIATAQTDFSLDYSTTFKRLSNGISTDDFSQTLEKTGLAPRSFNDFQTDNRTRSANDGSRLDSVNIHLGVQSGISLAASQKSNGSDRTCRTHVRGLAKRHSAAASTTPFELPTSLFPVPLSPESSSGALRKESSQIGI